MTLNPVAYWRLGEGGGTTAEDYVSGDHAGTYTNTPTLGSDPLLIRDGDPCVTFTAASSEYVTIADDSDLDLLTNHTIMCWVDPNTTNFTMFVTKRGGGGGNAGWTLRKENGAGGNVLGYLIDDGVGQTFMSGSTDLISGGPYFICGTMEADETGRLYVNAVQEDTDTGLNLAANAVAVNIGRRGDATNHMDGEIDEVAIFDYVLSVDQIARLFRIGTGQQVNP